MSDKFEGFLYARESKDEIGGALRIVDPKSSFAPILMPVVNEFCRRYPAVQPEIQLDDGKSNWVLERVDVGFRIGAATDEGVIARRLFPVQLIICAAPAYIERHGAPRTLAELQSTAAAPSGTLQPDRSCPGI